MVYLCLQFAWCEFFRHKIPESPWGNCRVSGKADGCFMIFSLGKGGLV